MGQGWRRVTEAVRQKVGSATFKPTSNARNEAMFQEATEFAQLLKVLEKDIRALEKQVDNNFSNLRGILESPVPRVYEEGQDGAVACDDVPRQIGQGVHFDSITDAATQMKRRLEQEVIAPLKHWMLSYRSCQDRMNMLEKLRLEVDSRRRTVDGLRGRVDGMRSKVGEGQRTGRLDPRHEAELDRTASMHTHKTEKLERSIEQYTAIEQTVFNSLFTLVRDTHVLRDYTRTSLHIVQECYASAYSAYEGQVMALEATLQSGTGGNHVVNNMAYLEYPGHSPAPRAEMAAAAVHVRPAADRAGLQDQYGQHHGPRAGSGGGKAHSGGAPGGGNIYAAGGPPDATEHEQGGYDQAPPAHGGYGGAYPQPPASNPYANPAVYGHGAMHSPGRYGPLPTSQPAAPVPAQGGWHATNY